MSIEKKPCLVPTCPMMGKSSGRQGDKKRKVRRFRLFCGFHSKAENRGKYHPTQNFKVAQIHIEK